MSNISTFIDSIEGDFTETAENRRGAVRTPVRLAAGVVLLTEEGLPEVGVMIQETSRSGLSFEGKRAFGKGEPVMIKLRFLNRDGKLILAVVRHVSAAGAGYRVGVEFVEAVSMVRGSKGSVPGKWVGVGRKWREKPANGV